MINPRFLKSYVLRRDKNGAQFVKGKRIADVWEDISIRASLQPMSGKEVLDEFPGNERPRDTVKFYTKFKVRTVDDVEGFKADRIVYQEKEYECQIVEDWTQHSLKQAHYKVTAVAINSDQRGT